MHYSQGKIYQISQFFHGILLFCNKIRFMNQKMSNSEQHVKKPGIMKGSICFFEISRTNPLV